MSTSPNISRLQAWVTSSSQNPSMGVLPPHSYVLRAHLHVTQAFNSDGTDNITAGYDTDTDAIFTSVDVSTTGVKSLTLGALNGYNSVARDIEAYYVAGGSSPSQGKAFVVIEYLRIPPTP